MTVFTKYHMDTLATMSDCLLHNNKLSMICFVVLGNYYTRLLAI